MARTAGGPPSSKRSSQSVSPAVAALVIVVVLLAVFALVWKFTSSPTSRGSQAEGRGALLGGSRIKMPTTITPEAAAKAKVVQEKWQKALEGGKSSTATPP